MTTLIHVLGADIPHHNLTVLNFFQQHLSSAHCRHRFLVVSTNGEAWSHCIHLDITCYPDRKRIARAVLHYARQSTTRFFFHGQFNQYIWLALLTGRLKSRQMFWHAWGADLYEEAKGWRAKLLYRLRRLAQARVGHIFATRSDLNTFAQYHPQVAGTLLYFPTRMPRCEPSEGHREHKSDMLLTFLLGNSGDRSNRHIEALQCIHQQFGSQVKLVIPLGYPPDNQSYIDEVRTEAERLFPVQNLHLLTSQIEYDDYLAIVRRCDAGYFIFDRQQGIGTLCLLLQYHIPVVISRNNPFWQDMTEQHLPVLFYNDRIDETRIREAQQQLSALDKSQVAFFNPNYIQGWKNVLQLMAGEQ